MRLSDEVRHWWKLRSAQVMAAWSVLGGIIVAMWPVAQWLLNEILPRDPLWRVPFAVGVAAVTFGSFFYARFKPQPKLEKTNADPKTNRP